MSRTLLASIATALFWIGEPAFAESEEVPPLPYGPGEKEFTGPWRPPDHDPDEKDWLQLTSGEWLHGDIDAIADATLYFDSDELDDLEIDWDDIRVIRSAALNTYRMTDDSVHTGTLGLRDDVIRIETDGGMLEFPRDMMLSMVEGELRELNYWSFELGAGLTVRSGNSNQSDFTLRALLRRETPFTRATLRYDGALSNADGSEITNNRRLQALMDFYLTRRLFVRLPIIDLYQDRIRNIDLRATVGSGLGYELFKRKRLLWDVLLGAAYQRTEFGNTLVGEDDFSNDAAAVFGTSLELDPFEDVEWDTNYRLNLVVRISTTPATSWTRCSPSKSGGPWIWI